MKPPSPEVEAAARALAADLEFSCPVMLEGEDGWCAVTERVLSAAAAARDEPEEG